jgi:hypothetical protein
MIPLLSREVCAVVDGIVAYVEGRMTASAVMDRVRAARAWSLHARGQVLLRCAAVHGQPAVAAAVEKVMERLDERDAALDEISRHLAAAERASLPEAGRRLQEVSFHITTLADDIDRTRAALPPDCAHPQLDTLIKATRTAADGGCGAAVLAPALARAVEIRHELVREASLFRETRPQRADLLAAFEEALQMYETGVGAVAHALEAGEAGPLHDAVPLLKAGTAHMLGARRAMAQIREKDGASADAVLDAFALAARKGLDEAGLAMHRTRLAEWARTQRAECLALARLRPALALAFPSRVEPALARLEQAVETATGAVSDRRLLELFRIGQDVRVQRRAWEAKHGEERSFDADPAWDDVRRALRGWSYGFVPRPSVLGALDRARAAAAARARTAAATEETERDALEAAARLPLDIFDRALGAVLAEDRAAGPGLVAELEDAYDRWLWLGDIEGGAACMVCGTSAPSSAAVCPQCGTRVQSLAASLPSARLPPSLLAVLRDAIDGGSPLQALRPRLVRCREIARRAAAQLGRQSAASGDEELDLAVVQARGDLARLEAELDLALGGRDDVLGALRDTLDRLASLHGAVADRADEAETESSFTW